MGASTNTNYKGKTAVITGGTSGIGLATAKALVGGGAKVIATGQSERNIEAAKLELGANAVVLRSDAGSLRNIEELRSIVKTELGRVDFVFLNAGYTKLEPFDQVTEAEYDRTFNINTKGVFFAVQRLAPLVRRGGSFLFMASITNETGYPGLSAFTGSRAAVRAYARVLGAELLPRGIRVNVISPGFIHTPTMGIASASVEQVTAFIREGEEVTPMKRIGTLDEVVRAALFLAFDATFTTGAELTVDGGLGQGIFPAPSETATAGVSA